MNIEEVFLHKKIRPYIIAEVSQNHDGSLGQAHAFIDAVAECGVDAIKFQTHIAAEESTKYEAFRVNFSYEDKSRYDYWKRMEFTEEQWYGLYKHASEKHLEFLSSPFSLKALELLDKMGVPAWKFGAGEVFNEDLIKKASDTGKPLLLSTGLSTYEDIDNQLSIIGNHNNRVLLFQCVTAYPSNEYMIDIGQIQKLEGRYNCPVGISDHSSTIFPALAATTMGAKAIEVHVTMSKYMFGPDVKASVDLQQLKEIVKGARFISTMLGNDIDMSKLSEEQNGLRKLFSKSMYSTRQIEKGTIIQEDMFKERKPNIGVSRKEFENIIGKRMGKSIEEGEPLKLEDIE